MANLDTIKQLNLKYNKTSPISKSTSVQSLNEGFDPDRIEKAFDKSIAGLGINYVKYFEMGMPAEVAMLFIDVCSFSTRYAEMDGDEIATYFDNYYKIVIPLIYKYNGEIDKIIGDGIIAVFGPPFLDADIEEVMLKAESCAKDIIMATKGTKYTSKIAFHTGIVNYFKNKSGLYNEFTIIGKPLTELFRLESISEDNCVNYYKGSQVSEYYTKKIGLNRSQSGPTVKFTWNHVIHPISGLKGVDYLKFISISYNP